MQNYQRKWYYIGLIMIPVIGHVLNMLCSHRNFYFNLYMLFAMLIIQLVVLKRIDAENLAIKRELLQAEENSIRGSFSAKTSMLLNVKGRLISIALVFIYIAAMFEIGCIELTITGIFGGILGAVVFYVGIQLYFRYLALLYFSWDLKNLQIKRYMFSFPALTD